MEVIRFATLPISAWRNGAGRKADIASAADWHVGFAWLGGDAPFSDFTGHDRTITLVDGPGFALEFPGRPALLLTEPLRPAAFDGGWPTQCRLLGGPCLVLNAMTARAQHRHTVEILRGGVVPEIGTSLLVLLAGEVSVSDGHETVDLQRHDTVRTDGPLAVRATPDACLCRITIAGENA